MFSEITNDNIQITNKFQSPKHQIFTWFDVFVVTIHPKKHSHEDRKAQRTTK